MTPGHEPARPVAMVVFPVGDDVIARLSAHFDVHHVPKIADRMACAARIGASVTVLITNGVYGCDRALLDALPALRIIAALGAGYENIDLAAARERGLPVSHGRDTNTASVADHALAILFAVVRDIPAVDRALRAGEWAAIRAPRPDLTGARLGLFGLGLIGRAIARRAAGFEMAIGYHSRRRIADVGHAYFDSLEALASHSDFLVCAVPGGPQTHHRVDAGVLAALGPRGYLVNIGRGSVVDNVALARALSERTIAGAALDVFEGEPELPAMLRDAPNLVVTPHMAGFSPNSTVNYVRSVVANVGEALAGRPILTPVPGTDPVGRGPSIPPSRWQR